MASLISTEIVANKILEIRGKKVMLDSDLAKLYEVRTKDINKAVKRNIERFPEDFMFQLSKEETENLRFQIGTSKRGGRRYSPYVFTQEGVAMLSGVLNSPLAIQVNIQIMRAFVQLRRMLLNNSDLRRKIEAMEKRYDRHFEVVFEAIKQLLQPPKQTRAVGFYAD
jgi:hypothetical protein